METVNNFVYDNLLSLYFKLYFSSFARAGMLTLVGQGHKAARKRQGQPTVSAALELKTTGSMRTCGRRPRNEGGGFRAMACWVRPQGLRGWQPGPEDPRCWCREQTLPVLWQAFR